jgi:hypothetical protein
LVIQVLNREDRLFQATQRIFLVNLKVTLQLVYLFSEISWYLQHVILWLIEFTILIDLIDKLGELLVHLLKVGYDCLSTQLSKLTLIQKHALMYGEHLLDQLS